MGRRDQWTAIRVDGEALARDFEFHSMSIKARLVCYVAWFAADKRGYVGNTQSLLNSAMLWDFGAIELECLVAEIVSAGLADWHDDGIRMVNRKVIWKAPLKDTIPPALRLRVYTRDGYRCLSCGTTTNLSCDHVIAESKGGPTTFENLQTLCRPCNSCKGVR